MSYAAHFSRFLQQHPQSLYFAAHRLHPLPDVSFEAHQQAWLACGDGPLALQQQIDQQLLPRAFKHIARCLHLQQSSTLCWAAGADALLTPLLAPPRPEPLQILCTDPLPQALAPTLLRLEALGRADILRVSLQPFQSFEARWGVALRKGNAGNKFDWICLSQCCSDSAFVPGGLVSLSQNAVDSGARVLIDGSHGFMAMEVDLSSVADRVSYLAEAPPYAMSGFGYAFLHDAGAASLNCAAQRLDPGALQRFVAAMDWAVAQTLTAAAIHSYVGSLQARFLSRLDALRLPLSRGTLMPPLSSARGNFLCFSARDASDIARTLNDCDVIVDSDDERLRIGFDIHHSHADIDALLARLQQALA